MHDQPELFDLPAAQVAAAPQSARGRTRETYARTVVADVTVRDVAALRAEALRCLDEGVIVIGEAVDPWHPTALRAAMGATFSVPIARCDLSTFKNWASEQHLPIVGASD